MATMGEFSGVFFSRKVLNSSEVFIIFQALEIESPGAPLDAE